MVQINIAKFMIDSSFEINLQGISIVESFHGATAEPQYNAITYLKCEFNSRVYISVDYKNNYQRNKCRFHKNQYPSYTSVDWM